jgi:hypothetical protein
MYKKAAFILLFLFAVNTAFAASPHWNGTISRVWDLAGNWDIGTVPTSVDTTYIYNSPGPIIDSSTTAVSTSIRLGGSSGGDLEMTGGTLDTVGSWIILGYDAGSNGTFTMSGGTVNTAGTMYAGFNGNGTMYMNGGTINVNGSRFGIARNSAASIGRVYLNGGVINCLDFSMAFAGGTASMDITGGKLVVSGDKTATIAPYIASGWITAYGGAGTVQMDYGTTTPGKTTVMSSIALPVATNPSPSDGAINIPTNATLSWTAGTGATSHDVYFGTTDPPAFIGNQIPVTYNPGALDADTTYYWRIDAIKDSNTYTGTVWDFTTAGNFKKGPYLIYPGNNTQMTVLWQMTSTVGCTLEWGLDTSYAAGSTATTEYGTDHQHKYTITSLTPGTKYYYRITAGTAELTGSFRSAPAADVASVKLLAYGDTRTNPTEHSAVCAGMNSTIAGDPDYQTILLHTGDWVNADTESDWTGQFFNRSYPDQLQTQATLPIQGCMGNHEGGAVYYTKYWPYPYTAARYWSFDYGPAHIAFVDQYTDYSSGSAQLIWLANDLSASTKKWKFIVLHEPGWTAGGNHGNNADVQSRIQPLCEQYGVQMVLAGHNHYYSRAVVNGVQHITSGGGGAPLYTPVAGQPNIVIYNSTLQYCKISIDGNSLSCQSVKPDGSIIDSFYINLFQAANPSPSNGDTGVATNATLSWTAGAGAVSHDVYFGTTSPGTFQGNQTALSFDPCTLAANTTYYWRIDEKDGSDNTTTGEVWNFTTALLGSYVPINIHLCWDENNVASTMLVKWATPTDADSIVKYGSTSSYGSQQTGTSLWSSSCNQYIHTVKLTGLTADSTYHYSCGSTAGWSADAAFVTGLTVGDSNSFIFAAGGDTRNPDDITPNATYAAYRITVMNAILSQQPKFFIFLGDYTNRGRYQEQWDEIFSDLKPQHTTMSYMMVWGSHEDPDIAPNAYAQFDFPPNGVTGDGDKYYSFDYGNAHFITLFATAALATSPLTEHLIPPGSAQYNWLVNDLQQASNNPNIEWKFISVHAPPYSTATRAAGGSCVGLRADIGPLIDQYGVDVVFTAHEHNFERTHLIKNDSKVMDVPNSSVLMSPQGAIYYVSGGAGAGLNDCDGNGWFSAVHQNLRHFLRVQVNGKTLNIKAIQSTGALLDEITIQHHKLGDFDMNGKVDMKDLSVFTGYWLDSGMWP